MIEFKILQFEKMSDIFQIARDQVIHAYHIKSLFDKTIAKMRAKKACRAGDQNATSWLPEGGI